jgi:hypothetical protein
MLEFKAQAPIQVSLSADPRSAESAISDTNHLRIETSNTLTGRKSLFADFDIFGLIAGFFAAAWSTDRAQLQPIPVRVRNRR